MSRLHSEAVHAYDRTIASGGASPDLLAGRGTALQALLRDDEALRDLDAALAGNPDLDEARYHRSVVTGQLGDHRAALDDLDRNFDRGFRLAYVYSDRGALHFRLGDLDKALSDCRTAVEL